MSKALRNLLITVGLCWSTAAFAVVEVDRWRSTGRRSLPAPALPETATA